MKKVKLQFTHKDGDGLGCALPLRFTEDLNDFIVIQCSFDEIDSTIESFLDFYDDPKNPDEIEAILRAFVAGRKRDEAQGRDSNRRHALSSLPEADYPRIIKMVNKLISEDDTIKKYF